MRSLHERVRRTFPARVTGQVHRLLGAIAESRGLFAPVGAQCEIICRDGRRVCAEVVGFRDEHALVAPSSDTRGISAGDAIEYTGRVAQISVGDGLLGRVINATGRPIDGRGPLRPAGDEIGLHREPESPLRRREIDRVLPTGVRAIDALFTVGCGQRLGIFSGSGVGKSTLLGMLTRGTEAPVVVLGLVGERSREVRDFVENEIGEEGLRRAVVVAATAEESALERIQAAYVATTVAEHFRDRGENVLLLLDSLTRVAMAQREIGLAMGEPPTTKGYPPSVFTLLPRLLERAGPSSHGSITGFYSVLVEADDRNDPVADSVRALLDGHVWLSRDLAEKGRYPAIDPLASGSRVQKTVVDAEHLQQVADVRGAISRFQEAEELLRLSAYVPGADQETDIAIENMPSIREFLTQDRSEILGWESTRAALGELARPLAGSSGEDDRSRQVLGPSRGRS